MELIIFESEAYKLLSEKIDRIADYVVANTNIDSNMDNEWVDSYEVCTYLRISERTLQRLRTNGKVTYSVISGKTYYTIGEIKRLLRDHIIRRSEENLQNLIDEHRQYNEIRKCNKYRK